MRQKSGILGHVGKMSIFRDVMKMRPRDSISTTFQRVATCRFWKI